MSTASDELLVGVEFGDASLDRGTGRGCGPRPIDHDVVVVDRAHGDRGAHIEDMIKTPLGV